MPELGRLETVYGVLPAWLQSTIFSLWGLRSRQQRFGGEFPELLAGLISSDFDDAEAISRRQTDAMRAVLTHAFSTVPHYRDLARRLSLAAADFQSLHELEKLPVLQKADVRQAPERFISGGMSQNRLLAGRTSGTTGTPLIVYQTQRALRFQWAIWWRHKARFGIRLGDPFLSFGARIPALGNNSHQPWRENVAIRQTYLVSSLLTGRPLDRAIDMVRRREFVFFTGYPSAMYVLARAFVDRGIVLEHPPQMIFTGSDALTPGFREVIEQAFAASVSDNFGSAEMCCNLSQCPAGKYHVDHEFGIVEFLPIPGNADPSVCRLVCTGLVNYAMPMIRYDLGDNVLVGDGSCTCGRSSPTVEAVEGRTEDFIRTLDGRLISGLNQVLEWLPGVHEAQVRQDELAAIDVLLVTSSAITETQESVLRREMRKRAGDALSVRVRRVDAIPRLPNGKFRAVVSTIAPTVTAEKELSSLVRGDELADSFIPRTGQ